MALLAVGLLGAFALAVAVAIGGFVAVEVLLLAAMSPFSLLPLLVAPGLAVLVKALCSGDDRAPKVSLDASSAKVWALVRSVAADAGAREPTSVHLDAGVAVRLLSRRRLVIGVPLLAAVNPDQLRALLRTAFQQDIRFGRVIAWGVRVLSRARDALAHARGLGAWTRPVVRAFTAYYVRVAERVWASRDPVDVQWEREVLEELWERFLRRYAALGLRAGYLPSRPMAGFRRLLDAELPLGDEPRASALLAAESTLDQAFSELLTDEQRAMPRADWDTLADLSQRHAVTRSALEVLGGLSLGDALDRLTSGDLASLAKPGAADVVASVRQRLSLVVTAALADARVVHWRMAWPGPPEMVVGDPGAEEITAALDAAAAVSPDVLPLRMVLVVAGVSPEYRPVPRAAVSG
ncbi:hypothetical protein [Amycolatopsis sp. FDAARGOS 1241]|uniref:hypothetical protein n=1 Tax=Amycolatopsis sp. FDAARGOS 1241 TaxID=2778070 RepID=UPI00194DD9D1|nr:hypothetical protein [Amycolatopsis sp. FDAARGOS 1241]QRP46505.1 hypothetical protein I6J71_47255 [Amycolatopsis sp. FDAARGOS 1241]